MAYCMTVTGNFFLHSLAVSTDATSELLAIILVCDAIITTYDFQLLSHVMSTVKFLLRSSGL